MIGSLLLAGPGQESRGNPASEGDLDTWLSDLGRMNRPAVMEGAGSHGTWGFHLGAGLHTIPLQAPNPLLGDSMRDGGAPETVMVPRLHALHGSPWPVDGGVSVGVIPGSDGVQWGGFLQWALYESLGMPALAVRAHVSRTSGLDHAEIGSSGVDLLMSYGFLRYFSLMAGMGAQMHQVRVTPGQETKEDLFINRSGEPLKAITDRRYAWDRYGALSIRIIPPFTTLAIGRQIPATGEAGWAARISSLF